MTKSPNRKNEEITASQVFLEDLKRLISLSDALAMAKDKGGDLIEVDVKDTSPVCRIVLAVKQATRVEGLPIEEMPTPIALMLASFEKEKHPRDKLSRLMDAVEVLVKMHTVAIVSDYFSRAQVSEEMKGLLGAGLKMPSLGIWWKFARDICKAHKTSGASFFVQGIDAYVLSGGPLFNAMQGGESNNLITFRNRYRGHGATLPIARAEEYLAQWEPVLMHLIREARHWADIRLITVKQDGSTLLASGVEPIPSGRMPEGTKPGQCYLLRTGEAPLSLHPLLVFRERIHRFSFYNDMDERDADVLNYDECIHERDVTVRQDLLRRYPIHDWCKRAPQEFLDDIQSLTEDFKGRLTELNRILDFVMNHDRGFLVIWGGPGVGKSALLARAVQALKWRPENRRLAGLNADYKLGQVIVIEYFVRRSAKTDNITTLLDNLSSRIEIQFQTGIPMGDGFRDKAIRFMDRLRHVSGTLNHYARLVIMIDGLDEGADKPGFLENLPTEAPSGVVIIYTSRRLRVVDELVYERLDMNMRDSFTLTGLDSHDVRAMLDESVNKYAVRSEYVEQVVSRSQGNPLFLKLLCRGLERGDYQLNDLNNLPTEVAALYKAILHRISKEPAACDFIRLLAVARESLPYSVAAAMMGVSLDQIEHRLVPTCLEVLSEDLISEDLVAYRLFHETLREYVRAKYSAEYRYWELRLADWCCSWEDYCGPNREYAVRWLIPHTLAKRDVCLNLRRDADACDLVDFMAGTLDNPSFRKAQLDACKNATLLQRDLTAVQNLLAQTDQDGSNMSRILRFSRMFHVEASRLYTEQIERLGEYGRKNDFLSITHIAEMGATPRDKTLLFLRALWENPASGVRIPLHLRHVAENWITQAADPELERLWKMRVNTAAQG